MSIIKSIHAREILDSRGNPTLEVNVITNNGGSVAMVPSGASRGVHEAKELRDGGKRYNGLGVQKAIKNVNTIIAKKLKGCDTTNQEKIDQTLIKLDGTKDKHKLGANTMLGVSLACARAGAYATKQPTYKHIASMVGIKKPSIPMPACNIINGGKHAGNGLDFQEYMIIPTKAKSFEQAMQMVSETYHALKQHLLRQGCYQCR